MPEIPVPEDQIHIGDTYPGTPSTVDLWVDTSECPPVLQIYDDCDDPGNPEWTPIGGDGTVKPIDPTPGDGNNSITPTPPGSGTEADPYVLTAKEVEFGGTVTTDETISFSNQKPGAYVQFVDQNSSTNGARYTQPIGVIAADGTWSGKLTFTDTPESTDETAFTGLLKIGNSSIYYSWGVTAKSGVVIKKPEVLTPPAGAGIGGDVTYTPETSAIAAGGVEAENLTLTKLVWNTPSAGSWNIYGIKVNGQFLTDESLFTHLNISDPQHIWDGDESLTAILGPTSTLEVDISGFNPITKLEMKDYGDGADDGYWQLFQDNGKGEWLAYNGSDEVVLPLSTSPSGYVCMNGFHINQTNLH